MDLKGRSALVTGSTKGLGLACARALYDAGASVLLTGRHADLGEQALALFDDDSRVGYLAGDATHADDVDRFVDGANERFGALDILVNNVGGVTGNAMGPFVEVTDETWLDMFTLNVHAAFHATRRALPAMVERGWGRVINMSSVEGKQGFPGQAAYVTTKHALVGMTKAVAHEVGASGVTVNALCPGLCATETMKDMDALRVHSEQLGLTPEALIEVFAQKTAIKRLIEPEEVGAMALFLCSDAGAAITGTQLSIDGGQAAY
ncbi:MAG TPA: SDR family NAD(P)-dependent oxidoreductase [Acidimicrobiales bacterium]|nr:SDR family NAD(P)-dependent oxidoreductase [Acidimicrobiales bacterium]